MVYLVLWHSGKHATFFFPIKLHKIVMILLTSILKTLLTSMIRQHWGKYGIIQ